MSEISNKCYGNKTIAMLTPLEEKLLEALELCATQISDCIMFPEREDENKIYSMAQAVIKEANELKYAHH